MMYWEHAFGPGILSFGDLIPHGHAPEAVSYLQASQERVTRTLASMEPDQLVSARLTHFGEEWPAYRVISVLADEQIHHGAEVAVLRDLYRTRPRRYGREAS